MNKYIEHTLLKQNATKKELIQLFDEAKEHHFLGVCINPCNVAFASEYLKDSNVKIVTVIGFPLGASLTETKVFEAQKAIEQGADEIDMVLSVQAVKDNDYNYILNDIKAVKNAIGTKNLKVIIETDLLTPEEIINCCKVIKEAGADFAKTSTGFVKNGVGAKVEDIKLMNKTLKDSNVQIKASGGIKTREQALKLIEAGATRLGTSSGVNLINKFL